MLEIKLCPLALQVCSLFLQAVWARTDPQVFRTSCTIWVNIVCGNWWKRWTSCPDHHGSWSTPGERGWSPGATGGQSKVGSSGVHRSPRVLGRALDCCRCGAKQFKAILKDKEAPMFDSDMKTAVSQQKRGGYKLSINSILKNWEMAVLVGEESFPPSSHACKAPQLETPTGTVTLLGNHWWWNYFCPSLSGGTGKEANFSLGPKSLSSSSFPGTTLSHTPWSIYTLLAHSAEGMDMMHWPSSAHLMLIQEEGELIITNCSQFSKRHSETKQYCPALLEGPPTPRSAGCCLRGNLPHFPFDPDLLQSCSFFLHL